WDRVVVRGNPDSGRFIAFCLKGAKVVGASVVNWGREVRFAKALVQSGKDVADADLANEAVQLRALAA
ncbi:MAG TPA: oxidoreductase C-terminal domain-containing protein, partial [Alphaproteobacteria bacterium]|nr:oxidoreductase C-terminal domain-containing protein [Alphaproteobacteria bacterium]